MNLVNETPIVILNGWAGQQVFWQKLLDNLSGKVELIDVCDYLVSNDFDDITKQIVKLIPNKAYLIGWSLGGQVALNIAAKYPNKIKKLITISTNPKFIEQDDWPGMYDIAFTDFYSRFIDRPIKTINYFFRLQLMGTKNLKRFIAQLPQIKNINVDKLKHGLQILQQIDLRDLMPAINVPNLHIYGKQDRLVPYRISTHMKNAKVITEASHMPFFTHANECCEIINRFFV